MHHVNCKTKIGATNVYSYLLFVTTAELYIRLGVLNCFGYACSDR